MIFYTLLPTEERRALRREYRLRLCIILLLFVSCGIILGIAALIPAYLHSYAQESEALSRQEQLLRNRKASGAEQIEQDLVESQAIAEKIKADEDSASHSAVLQKIIVHRPKDIYLSSFSINRTQGTTTSEVVIQGKATTREALLAFKKTLESDTTFTAIDLPLSDLAKSKNITFAMKFTAKKI